MREGQTKFSAAAARRPLNEARFVRRTDGKRFTPVSFSRSLAEKAKNVVRHYSRRTASVFRNTTFWIEEIAVGTFLVRGKILRKTDRWYVRVTATTFYNKYISRVII